MTGQEGQADNSPYVLREGENPERNFELANEAIKALNEDRAVYGTSGNLPRDRAPSRTIALGISPQFIAQGTIDLTGQSVSSAEDLAKLAHVYCDLRFETLRIFYVKGEKIVGHEGITSRLPELIKFAVTVDDRARRIPQARKCAWVIFGHRILGLPHRTLPYRWRA